jgi:hypothetical protein
MLEIDNSLGCPDRQKIRGCSIGYALAVNLCERVDSVDACTTTAPDAITAFAVPSPGCFSRQLVFSGLVAQRVTSLSESLGLLRTGFTSPTLSAVDAFTLPCCDSKCSDEDHTPPEEAAGRRRTQPEQFALGLRTRLSGDSRPLIFLHQCAVSCSDPGYSLTLTSVYLIVGAGRVARPSIGCAPDVIDVLASPKTRGEDYLNNQIGIKPTSAKAERRPRLRTPVLRSENTQA